MRLASIVVNCISYYQLQTYLLRDRGKLSLVAGTDCSLLFGRDPLKLNHMCGIGGMGGEGTGETFTVL